MIVTTHECVGSSSTLVSRGHSKGLLCVAESTEDFRGYHIAETLSKTGYHLFWILKHPTMYKTPPPLPNPRNYLIQTINDVQVEKS